MTTEGWTPTKVPAADLLVRPVSVVASREGMTEEEAEGGPQPEGEATVLPSTVVLISELNILVASLVMLKEPPGAKSRYSTAAV